jgi:hypothetical protein
MYIDEKVTSVHYGTDDRGNPCVPARFDSAAVAHPIAGCHGKVYEVGTKRLTPADALDYTRQREWLQNDDGDYGRQRHQQQFIKALVKEAKSQGLSTNPIKTFQLVSSMLRGEDVDQRPSVADWVLTRGARQRPRLINQWGKVQRLAGIPNRWAVGRGPERGQPANADRPAQRPNRQLRGDASQLGVQ